MPLESATYPSQLVKTNPVHTDPVSQGDSHLTLLKTVIQNQFPNFTAAPLNSTQAQIDNTVNSVAGNSITAGSGTLVPIGGIILFYGNTLPYSNSTNWGWCNGGILGNTTVLASLAAQCPQLVSGTNVLAPDLREVVPMGRSTMGGTSSRGLVSSVTPGSANATLLGASSTPGVFSSIGGISYTMLATDIAAHTHGPGTLSGTAAAQGWSSTTILNSSLVISDTRAWGLGLTTTSDGQPGAGRIGWVSGGNTAISVTSGSISLAGSITGSNAASGVTISGGTTSANSQSTSMNITQPTIPINFIIRIL